jgi:predicted double-glycine peptidase
MKGFSPAWWMGPLACLLAGCYTVMGPEHGAVGVPVRDPKHHFQREVWSWQAMKEEYVVMQKRDYSCGAAALATVATYHYDDPIGENEFLEVILARLAPGELQDRVANGLSMTDLRLAAVQKGYLASIGRITMQQLLEVRVPVIVRIAKDDYEHFVVVRGVVLDRVFLADPIRGNVRMSVDEFSRQWTDGAILVMAKPGVPPPQDSDLSLWPRYPIQPELDEARRSLFLRHH